MNCVFFFTFKILKVKIIKEMTSKRGVVVFMVCLVLGAFASSCDDDQKVKDCLSEYRYCEGREASAASDPKSLCIMCIRALGLCLDDLKCYNTTWEHYSFLCTNKAHCRKCLMSPDEILRRKEEYERYEKSRQNEKKAIKKRGFFGRMFRRMLRIIKSILHI